MSSVMITASHVRLDLVRPDLGRIDIRRDIAEPLAVIPRFGGHEGARRTDRRIWSVGQHCVVGAKAMLDETGDPRLALGFLLHDAHEAFIGDITTPTRDAIAVLCAVAGAMFRTALADLKQKLDAQIHVRAGLQLSAADRAAIHLMDMRMLASEARQILGVEPEKEPHLWPAECPKATPVRTNGALCPWPAKRTADEWMALWDAWRPMRRAA